jgi:glutathione peroxidase
MKLSKVFGKNAIILHNKRCVPPSIPLYSLQIDLINGGIKKLENLKGKKLLLVNTASECGYTAQYKELQKLQDTYAEQLVVIGFPANDFKEQEKAGNDEIVQFCKTSFGVRFPLVKKSVVVKSDAQNEVFNWLTHSNKNGWNDKAPEWNFSKYLINEHGMLTHYFGPAISPMDEKIIEAIKG